MQRSLWGHGGVAAGYMTSVIASRDGTHVIVIAANGHNQQAEDAIFATAERLIASSVHELRHLRESSHAVCVLRVRVVGRARTLILANEGERPLEYPPTWLTTP
jgi:hypothetical protein